MKRLLCFLLCLFSLLLTACSSNDQMKNEAKEYEHTPYVSSIEQADCFLCGESKKDLVNLYWDEDNVGIINLNTFEFTRLEINRYDDHGNLITEKAGFMQSGGLSSEDAWVHSMTDPDRGYSHVQIIGEKNPIDADAIQSHLCQICLDTINDMYFGDYAPSEYAVISFADKTIRPFIQNTTWFTFGNYGIECDFEEDGDIDLFVVYCPPRYENNTP